MSDKVSKKMRKREECNRIRGSLVKAASKDCLAELDFPPWLANPTERRATHGILTVTPQKITPFTFSMMASVLSMAQTVASPGSTRNPTDTATSQSQSLPTESHCCLTHRLLCLNANFTTLEEVMEYHLQKLLRWKCVSRTFLGCTE